MIFVYVLVPNANNLLGSDVDNNYLVYSISSEKVRMMY